MPLHTFKLRHHLATATLFVALLSACDPARPDAVPAASVKPVAAAPATSVTTVASTSPAPSASAAATPSSAFGPFGEVVQSLSEKGGDFISDNLISNETSYLQVAKALAARPAGGVYIGVGPEQNFTYLALTRPKLALIVDIRRDNLLQHLYYRYLLEEATSRSHFLALLVGRPYDSASAPADGADIDAVLKHAETKAPDEKLLDKTMDRALNRMTKDWGITLDDKDTKSLRKMAKVFLDKQLDLRFELKESSGRKYPMLRELLAATDPDGKKQGFLATNESFRFVQTMAREGRIVPVVGDFGGDHAFSAIAQYLKKNDLKVTTFYVSNVEQYLLEPAVWTKWLRNVEALPRMDDALFVRCYLDQGKKHPKQMEGHRTATVLSKVGEFLDREKKKPSRSFYAISTEGIVE